MTDKEMAEEYANKNVPIDTFGYSVHYDVKQAFMTGLETARLQWHDLRKDPNKANEWHEIASKRTPKGEISEKYMPKNKEKVLLKYHFSRDNEIHISDGYYDVYDSEFHIANNPEFRIVCVLAWREFLEKENE